MSVLSQQSMKSVSDLEHKKALVEKRPLKEFGMFLADILYNAVVIITLVVLIRTFLISPFRVIGSSMADTLVNNEFILIDKLSYTFGEPRRGDPIVFLPPISNKYPYKFQETVTTDENGVGTLDISDLKTDKQVFYCQNKLIKSFWLCTEKVNVNDLVYSRPVQANDQNGLIDLSWKNASKKLVSVQEVSDHSLQIEGEKNQKYMIRIYNSTGPEYFVKRVIGIPGDTIRIENGRVYLKKVDETEFTELNEVFLNDENRFNTYVQKFDELNEYVVPAGHYFALGDNRNHSNDSRHWYSPIDEVHTPFVPLDEISGRVLIVLWPPNHLRLIPAATLEGDQ